MSDELSATLLLSDAFRGNFDTAMVMSGDADVVPPIRVASAQRMDVNREIETLTAHPSA